MVEALGGKCEVCGATENLVIHHRDHNHSNNARSNLVILCVPDHRAHHREVNGKVPFEKQTINVTFNHSEFQQLVVARGSRNWHDFILNLLSRPEPIDRRMDKKLASAYSKRGHTAEDLFWGHTIQELFRGTGAKVTRVGGFGKEDGIIDYNGLTFICDSFDYCIPLDRTYSYVDNRNLTSSFKRYRIEKQRGNSSIVIAVIYHEVNRNGWTVKPVSSPMSIPLDLKGRPTGSQKIDLRILKPGLTLSDFDMKEFMAQNPLM